MAESDLSVDFLRNYVCGFADDNVGLEDAHSLEKGIMEFENIFGKTPDSLTGDQGFWSRPNLETCKSKEIKEVGISPRGHQKWKGKEQYFP